MPLSPEEYLAERVDDQIRWYGDRSRQSKQWFYALQIVTLFASASIPVLSLTTDDFRMRILVAFFGAVTAVTTGLVALFRFQELWVSYRVTTEALKSERFLFVSGAEPYTDEAAFSRFVGRIETLITNETQAWRRRQQHDASPRPTTPDGAPRPS